MNEQNEGTEAPASAVEAGRGATIQDASASPSPGAQASVNSNPGDAALAADASTGKGAGADREEGDAVREEGDSVREEGDSVREEGDSDREEGDADDGASEHGVETADGQAAGEPGKRKRRRRRRKKGPNTQAGPEGAEGAQGVEAHAHAGPERPPRHEKHAKEGPAGIYARFFEGPGGGKRHAFTAGEIVAGRVSVHREGAFAVDLFGKATAFVDIFEPRAVPAIPDPSPEREVAPPEAAAGEAAASSLGGPPTSAVEVAGESAVVEVAADPSVVEVAAGTGSSLSVEPPEPERVQAVAELASFSMITEGPVAEINVEATSVASTGQAASAGEVSSEPHTGEEVHAEAEHAEPEPEPEAPPPPGLGEIFRGRIGFVAESGHVVIVNRIVDGPAATKRLEAAREARRRVRGVVFGFNRGGFDVMIEGIRVFCPASGMSLAPLDNPDEVLGQRLEFTLPPTKAGTHGFVVSRRGILERQQRKAAKQLFKSLQPGQRLKGVVTHVRDFGVFVDLGGIEGLVHQSELSFNRAIRPADAVKSGDEVEVRVLRVGEGPTRRDRERVSLSIKALLEDPWAQHADLLEPGSVHTGKVTGTTDFGAFVELAENIEGLLHISELGRELKHANQALQEGQEVRVVVERVDRKLRRISLSRLSAAEEKAMAAGEAEGKSDKPPKLGAHVTVTVEKVEPMGLIVQFPGVFGRRGRGFIPNAEMGTERGTDHRKGFAPGTQIPVKVVALDRDGGLRCSRKLRLVEEEKRAVQDYRREAARQGLGTFGDLLRAKLEGKQTP